ncbi:hypothetical protein EDD17DRAFT_1837274 [Pisolithus thermaeus]|nr:hypothetical protein EDD17DRAFT_1837274 [Pisolithus thermaeus]
MSAPQAFNIMLRMIHLQLFHWFKQFAKGSILMDTALDNIEFALGSDFDSSEWMDLAYCIVMELGCWGDVEKSYPPNCPEDRLCQVIKNLPLDKIGYGELDDRMRKYGSHYIHKEWKPLINEIFLQSDPGAEDAVPAPLVVQRVMELQGISLMAIGVQRKCRKVSASIFIDMDVEEDEEGEEEGEEEEEEEKEEDEQEEGGSIHRPQQAEPSGKRSYLQSIDSLCKQFSSDIGDLVVVNHPPNRQIPTTSSRTFALEYIKLRGLMAMTLLWLPHQVYVEASCPLEVQQNLPPSCSRSHKEITLLPLQEGMSIMAFRARQVLPTWSWVRIWKSMYKGDIGYIEESADSDAVVILIAPCRLPYDLPEESGESVRFDVELARMAGLDLMPILSPSGTEIGYSCDGQQFVHGLFRLTLPANTLEIVELPHPNDIRFHVAAGIDPYFVEETLNLFLAQFWVFSLGDTLEIIAGPFCGETGYIVALHEHTIVLVVMRPNQTSEDIKVSRFVVQSHLQDHVLSLSPVAEPHVVLPLSEDKALLGDVVRVHHGLYASQTGIIEWISPDGKVWMFNCGKGKGKEDSKQDPTPSQSMVTMNASDLRIERAPGTLTLSKDKGYNIAVGDMVEVARGQWCHSQGIVKVVDLIKASLDFVHLEDGIQINIPIMFSCKVKERFDYGLSKFIGCDVWVMGGDKKGTRAMLCSLGRTSSWVAIFGQLIKLKNNQPSAPNPPLRTSMLLDGTLLPLRLQCSLKSLCNQSFITPVVPRNVTPPPSPGLSNAGPSDAWSITPDDIIWTQTPDYGEVPWLFQSEFCDFKSSILDSTLVLVSPRSLWASALSKRTLCQPTPPAKINYAWYLRDLKQEDSYI